MKYINYITVSVIMLIISLVTVNAEVPKEMKNLVGSSLIDKDGKNHSVEVLNGKIVGLYFSASWCPPCKTFSPKMRDFRNKYQGDFEVVMVSADGSSTEQLKYMTDMNMPGYAVGLNSTQTNLLYNQFKITGIPSVVILSPDGKTITNDGRADISYYSDASISKWKNSSNYTPVKDNSVENNSGNSELEKEETGSSASTSKANGKVIKTNYVLELLKDDEAEFKEHYHILISDGDSTAPYYKFGDGMTMNDDGECENFINPSTFQFSAGETYHFWSWGISPSHPFLIGNADRSRSQYASGSIDDYGGITVKIPDDFNGSLIYYSANHTTIEAPLKFTQSKSETTPPPPPSFTPPSRPGVSLEEQIQQLKLENAQKDTRIAELIKRTEECEKLAVDSNSNCEVLTEKIELLEIDMEIITQNNNELQSKLTKAEETASACNLKLIKAIQELEEYQAISQTPFLTGWIYQPDHGWIYTDNEIFPYLYLESTGNWLLYEIGSAEPHYFFNYNENKWQSW